MAKRLEQNAARLKALGHPVRLSILRFVVQGPEAGTPAGELQERLGIPASTLSHHLATLTEARLLMVEREGTFLRYRAEFSTLRALTDYLWEDCCKGGTGRCAGKPDPCCAK
jgi:DNA-binding transcriptional ArsR family regulator